jgi:hypothetical protein
VTGSHSSPRSLEPGVIEVSVLETDREPFGSRGVLQVFACIRARQGHPDAGAWREPFSALGVRLNASLGRGWLKSGPPYVMWKYIDAPDGAWDIDDITLRSREELLRLWSVAAPAIDTALAVRIMQPPLSDLSE